jgi:hypothetical protein
MKISLFIAVNLLFSAIDADFILYLLIIRTMNTRTLLMMLCALILSVSVHQDTKAQTKKNENGPPSWAPAHGYRANTRHIFFPEHNIYFDLNRSVYIFIRAGEWQFSSRLPILYKRFNLRTAHQVELNLGTSTPHLFNTQHREQYKPKTSQQSVQVKAGGNGNMVKVKTKG